ncbi:Rho termination factor, N-terminal domain [Prauserella aidingensis]|uniref:Rho termination factor N-terminal domain-containing protein n=1 Tax=Prauserella aidingensis TaxID=387890 RepID=UPI0020A4AC96|nr:transcription termination factor Rho [Prauserella aidingensis]MCP2254053.1 Rho termination factor, N-terminal domain [Prauserella aidingensis]
MERGRFGNHAAGYVPNMVHIPQQQNDFDASMAELAEAARAVGILSTAHMNKAELIEAIRQQQETNAVLRADRRHPGENRAHERRSEEHRAEQRPTAGTFP